MRASESVRISRLLLPLLCVALFSTPALTQPQASSSVFTFEVSTVKPDTSGTGQSGARFDSSGRFIATNVTLKQFLERPAFDIPGSRIIGGPKWLDTAHFDIDAKMDSATFDRLKTLDRQTGREATEAMFQTLLAERFHFKAHWEQRDLPAYALVVAKGGSKLQPAAHPERGGGDSSGNGTLQAVGLTLPAIADLFTQGAADDLGRVVVDRTGIAGIYDFRIHWTSDTSAATPTNQASANSGPSIFTAVQEQLGLKLEPTKAPIKVLVIDQLEMPSEN